MLAISITFAILVALWGFSSAIPAAAKRGIARVKARAGEQAAAPARPRSAAARTRPVASA